MRLLVLGGLGAYPERLHTFVEQGHSLWYAATHDWHSMQHQLGGIPCFDLHGPHDGPADPIEWLLALIKAERIEAVYSLLNVWDGSNRATAALLRRGCPVPVIRHYKEHYLSPSDDERTCLERSTGDIFINEESRAYFAGLYRLPARTLCLDGDLLPRRYLQGTLQPKLSAVDGARTC